MLTGCVPWPAELAERYRRDGYWRGEPLGNIARDIARSDPDRVAILSGTSSWTYGELDRRADRLAAGLRRLGIAAGDRVVVQLPNVPELIALCLALFRLGALPVMALPAHRRDEVRYLCDCSAAVAYVVQAEWQGYDYRDLARDAVAAVATLRHVLVVGDAAEFLSLADVESAPEVLPPVDASDVAFFLLSGGMSGVPKLIPRTHDDYCYQLRATARAVGFDASGVYLAVLPVAHNAALGCPGALGALLAGGRLVLADGPNPGDVFPMIQRHGVTLTTLISSLLPLWIQAASLFGVRFPRLLLQIGGARLDPAVGRKIRPALGCVVTHWFGMAEGPLFHTALDDDDETVIGTQGRPLAAVDEVRVVDAEGRDVPPGDPGELLVRGPYTLRGYYASPEHNARAFTDDGYLRTGDLVRLTPAGRLVVEGRLKDVINRGGEKISAEEVERHLRSCPAVRDVAVVPVPDALLGERTCAVVVPRNGAVALGSVREFLSTRGLADYKLPDRLEQVEALPRTAAGGVDKASIVESLSRERSLRGDARA
jgi:2,3-dihydroxybenzoate-AMP ligase